MSRGLSPTIARRDDRRLGRLQRLSGWLSAAAGLGLLGTLPAPASYAGAVGLVSLLLLAPSIRFRALPAFRKAPALLAPLVLLPALLGLVEPTLAVACVLAALLVGEAAGAGREPGRAPLFAFFAALLACTLASTPLLAPLLLLGGLACAATLCLGTLHEHEGAERSRAVTAPRQLGSIGGMLASLAPLAVLAFFVLPRHPGRSAQVPVPTHRLVGYSDHVRLGELAEALDDPTPIFRVHFEAGQGRSSGPFHFRGVALDHFDGETWSATATAGEPPPSVERSDAPVRQRYLFEPTAPPILVGVPRLEAISVPAEELQLAPSGTLLHRGGPQVHGYTAWSRLDRWTPLGETGASVEDPPPDALFLHVPSSLQPWIAKLAAEATLGVEGDAARAAALMDLLSERYRYERVPSAPLPERPLESFLLQRRQGHCELFATSLALMLRSQGIPSRVINGFYGGEHNPVGGYWLVRHADAHAWVEAWLPERGWVSLDPTPSLGARSTGLASGLLDQAESSWTHGVLALDGQAQLHAVSAPGALLRQVLEGRPETPSLEPPSRGLDMVISIAIIAGMLALFAVAWRRIGPWLAGERRSAEPASGEVERALRAGLRLLRQRGWDPPSHLPPASAARWLERGAGPSARPFATLAELHYRVRYGGAPDNELAAEARAALSELRALPPPEEAA
jgi:transglutaminase-like putative cysteine protease